MDMQIGLICGVFTVVASLIVCVILSIYSCKENSFDEARANRRKLLKEDTELRSNNDKSKQKKPKKVSKKLKDKKTDQLAEDDPKKEAIKDLETTKEAVNFLPKDGTEAPKKTESKKSESQKKTDKIDTVKPSQKPKTETEDSASVLPATVNPEPNSKKLAAEKKSKGNKVQGKDVKHDVEQSKEVKNQGKEVKQDIKQVKEAKQEVKQGKEGKQELKLLKEEKSVAVSEEKVANLKEPEKKVKLEVKVEKKKAESTSAPSKKHATGGDKQLFNVNSILSLIQKAELSRSEVQLLIDTLLNSEDETSDWLKVKKLDSSNKENTFKLKKQITDLELALKNEKQITTTLQTKLKELRTEMSSDKSAVTVLKETISKMQKEKEDILSEKIELSLKLKAVHDEKAEFQKQLHEEVVKIKQQQKSEEDKHIEAIAALKEEITTMSIQLESTVNENNVLKNNILSLEEQLNSHNNVGDKMNDLEMTVNNLTEKLVEKENEAASNRIQVDSVSATLNKFKKENKDLTMENETLNKKLTSTTTEIENLKKTLASLEKESNKNGNVNGIDLANDHLDCQIRIEEKENLLKQMTKQIDSNAESLANLKQELNSASEENTKLNALLDKTRAELTDLKENMLKIKTHNSEKEDIISSLRNTLNQTNNEIDAFKGELENYKQRNNELRNKNWKVVEALSTAEKALQNKLKSEEQENGNNHKYIEDLKNSVHVFVKRLFPDIDIKEHQGHFNDWLRSVEDTVSSTQIRPSLQDLQSQNTHLQSLVSTYKKIISETEEMLNKLQSHIEVEESKWNDEKTTLQREIESLRALQRSPS